MATMLPPQPVPGTSRPETRAFRGLEALPDGWICFHSVPWFGGEREGEGDFIVVAPIGGLLFIEVKPRCSVDEKGQWTRRNSTVVVKDPWEQARATGREVLRQLRRAGVRRRPAAYLACFPSGEPRFVGGIAAQAERSISADALGRPAALEALMVAALAEAARRDPAPLESFDAGELSTIRALLLVTGQVLVPALTAVRHAEEHRLELTAEQTSTYVDLMSMSRSLTLGGAGTGKTILASARAAQLSRQQLKTIVVVANALLAQRVSRLVAANTGNLTYASVLSLTELAASVPGAPTEADSLLDAAAWRRALIHTTYQADALIIDDAQHLTAPVIRALTGLLTNPEDGSLYLFADARQTSDSAWLPSVVSTIRLPVSVSLRLNCRNTAQISAVAAQVLGRPLEPATIDGPPVTLIEARSRPEAVEAARNSVRHMIDSGLKANDIAVLYDDMVWYRHIYSPATADDTKDTGGDVAIKSWRDFDHFITDTDQGYDWLRIPAVDVPEVIETVADGYGGFNYYVRRRTTLSVGNNEQGRVVVRCLHLESAIGLEFDAVILLLDPSSQETDALDVLGLPEFADVMTLVDDDGFDAGVWLKSLTGPDADGTRAYVGSTRARTYLTIVAPFEVFRRLRIHSSATTHGDDDGGHGRQLEI